MRHPWQRWRFGRRVAAATGLCGGDGGHVPGDQPQPGEVGVGVGDEVLLPALDARLRSCGMLANTVSAYVYILHCNDGRRYYGSTNDLIRRLAEHRDGRVRSTKPRLPVDLIYFEECQTLDQARQKERSFKRGRTRRKTIDLLIQRIPRERLAPFACP